MYRSDPAGGPDAETGVGEPAGSKEVAKRCTEAIRPVGPTLKNAHDCPTLQTTILGGGSGAAVCAAGGGRAGRGAGLYFVRWRAWPGRTGGCFGQPAKFRGNSN